MDKNSAILVAIAVILAIALLNAQLDGDKNRFDGSTNDTVDSSVNGSFNDTINGTIEQKDNASNITEEDKNFKNWVYISIRPMVDDVNCITKAAKTQDFNDTERCGRFLRDNSNMTLGQIDRYNISLRLEDARSEYRKSLEYFNLGGMDLETGARNRNPAQMHNAVLYIQNGTSSLERVMILLKDSS